MIIDSKDIGGVVVYPTEGVLSISAGVLSGVLSKVATGVAADVDSAGVISVWLSVQAVCATAAKSIV